jgi:hypothetical protein
MSQTDARPPRRLIWPAAVVVIGLTLTLSWIVLLVCGLARLIAQAM